MNIKEFIKKEAYDLGFDKIGFAKVEEISRKDKFISWLEKNYHANMKWMENYQDKRMNPSLLVDGSKSIIVLAKNYFHNSHPSDEYTISRYAVGLDYHDIIRDKMKILLDKIKSFQDGIEGRVFVDSAPVMERYWAEIAGIGWQGKNSLLISPEFGSYIFLSEIIINIEITADKEHPNRCGSCTRCINACPTAAIVDPYIVDASKCISYLSIEKRDELNKEESKMLGKHLFGCDICQEICPWNRFAKMTNVNEFKNYFDWEKIHLDDILQWTEEDFRKFKKSPISRTKLSGIKRNAKIIKENNGIS